MWLFIKADKVAKKWIEENKDAGVYYTADFAIGYALSHYPFFLLELFLETIFLVIILIHFLGFE